MATAAPQQCWLASLTTRHRSPIVQAFIKPGGKPWVIVTDPFESQDILQRRIREFDRSEVFGQLIGGILPEQHISFVSTDPRFKNNRNLINHLMAPTFISEVSAPDGKQFPVSLFTHLGCVTSTSSQV